VLVKVVVVVALPTSWDLRAEAFRALGFAVVPVEAPRFGRVVQVELGSAAPVLTVAAPERRLINALMVVDSACLDLQPLDSEEALREWVSEGAHRACEVASILSAATCDLFRRTREKQSLCV